MQLDDAAILEVIAQLSERRRHVGVPTLRNALKARFGASCGTDRLSKLLGHYRSAPPRLTQTVPPPGESQRTSEVFYEESSIARIKVLEVKLTEALEALEAQRKRAELAEAREISHQDRWAGEIYELRSKLRTLNPEQAVKDAKECAYLRIQNRHLSRLVSDLQLALAQVRLARDTTEERLKSSVPSCRSPAAEDGKGSS